MQNILVIIDGTEESEYALDIASLITKKIKGHLNILLFTEDTSDSIESITSHSNSSNITIKNSTLLDNELKIKARFKDLSSNIKHITDNSHKNILEKAQKLETDLIVLGYSESDKKDIELIRNSDLPIITITNKFKKKDIKNIVFASDFEENIKFPFSQIFHIANALKANLHLLYINTPDNFKETPIIQSLLDDFTEDYQQNSFTRNVYDANSPEEGIILFANEIDADLISTVMHNSTRIPLLSTSLSETLTIHSNLPVLLVNIL